MNNYNNNYNLTGYTLNQVISILFLFGIALDIYLG